MQNIVGRGSVPVLQIRSLYIVALKNQVPIFMASFFYKVCHAGPAFAAAWECIRKGLDKIGAILYDI